MQKYLRLLNLRLDIVVKDITGLTGLKIMDAICKGEVNAAKLASFRNGNCKKSEEEIAKALQNNGSKDYLFALKHEYKMYQQVQSAIKECDIEIEKMLTEHINIIKKQPYNNEHGYEFLDQKRKRKVQEMKKLIHKFDIKTDELGLQISSL